MNHLGDFFAVLVKPMAWVGVAGQTLFSARFVVQWLASERQRKSVIPVAFWYLSLVGGLLTLIYAVWRKDPVFTVAQSTGLLVYTRNLMLIHGRRDSEACD